MKNAENWTYILIYVVSKYKSNYVNGVRKRWICVFDRWIRTLEAFFFPRKGISAPPYDSSHKAGRYV